MICFIIAKNGNLQAQYTRKTGGKAGKGHNKTSTIQVFDIETNCIVKQFRYKICNRASLLKAIVSARSYTQKNKK